MRVNIKHLILIAAVGAAAACQDYERSVAAPSGDYASQQGQKAPEANRPIVRINCPRLIETANIHPDYVALLASVSESADTLDGVVDAIERALAVPDERSETRRAVAADLFYRPGGATARAVRQLYDAIELEPHLAAVAAEAPCRP